MPTHRKPLYQHTGTALLRAAASPLTRAPEWWPDPADVEECRTWLEQVWSCDDFADAVRQASPALAQSIDTLRSGHTLRSRQVRRATTSTARYLLRAIGRPTPFGLFAGVAPVALGSRCRVQWGPDHQAVGRVDTMWLNSVIDRLEACSELLKRVNVVFNNLAVRRGGRLQVPHGGPHGVSILHTTAVRTVQDAAAAPIRFSTLIDKLAEAFPSVDRTKVGDTLAELVRQGFLITDLRAPLTVTDPLADLVGRLDEVGADDLASLAPLVSDLRFIQAAMQRHNHAATTEQGQARETLARHLRQSSEAGRVPLAVDLLLDADVQLPYQVAQEMERAASALLRLTRQPTGHAVWRNFHAAFWEQYGTGTLVPLMEVVDPAAGLGFPAEYPGSMMHPPEAVSSERDDRLLALAWQSTVDDSREVVLTDEMIDTVAGHRQLDTRYIPPHVEMCARVHSSSVEALQRGDFMLTITPARSAGTLTSRFTPVATGSGLEKVYQAVPAATENAIPAQLSFPPLYPHTENVARIPAYLPHVISLGEHRGQDDGVTAIAVDDLAVTATHNRLYLVSLARRQVIEPQVFHAMALEKQPPPLARFLAHLPRAFSAAWTGFDWGPRAYELPYLPRMRYGRTVLCPARWYVTSRDLPGGDQDRWCEALDAWRTRWRCPQIVDLRDDDRTLRLTLAEPLHAAMLHAHIKRHGNAILTETTTDEEAFGWLDHHAHEIALPLVTARPPAPSPLRGALPALANHSLGRMPGSPDTPWLSTNVYTHPERYEEIITAELPRLLADLPDTPAYWFVRYRSPHETDHLRLRIRTLDPERYTAVAAAVGTWAEHLRRIGLASGLVFATYSPEIGRYGHGAAMEAAEGVFTADSQVAAATLRHLPGTVLDRTAMVAVNMVDIARGFLGPDTAMEWLASRPTPTAAPADRAVADQAIHLAQTDTPQDRPGWTGAVTEEWHVRAAALAFYRRRLPGDADVDDVLESLLHMHHNRVAGIDQDGEKTCRRLARQAALAWRARQDGHSR